MNRFDATSPTTALHRLRRPVARVIEGGRASGLVYPPRIAASACSISEISGAEAAGAAHAHPRQ